MIAWLKITGGAAVLPGLWLTLPSSSSEASSLSGLFTRVETGHITMSSAAKGREQIMRVGPTSSDIA